MISGVAGKDDQALAPSTVPGSAGKKGNRAQLFLVGELLNDNYEITGVLGEGGMGQVFEAKDHALDRRVAIKAGWPDRGRVWLRQEARVLAALRHASMVSVFHVGTHHDTDYVVMERIYGISLATHIARRKRASEEFSIREVLDVLIGVADGIATVHRAGLAHRDVKPANVMLAPGNRIVLMDFGLSMPESEQVPESSPAGTPDYMAPEAILLDARSGERFFIDLYALGVLAYEMLTLQTPFSGRTTVDVWTAHLSHDAPDPRDRRNDIPPQLAELCLSLMAKTPDGRPQSIETVVLALRAIRGADEPARTGSLSVLIVDDDPDITPLLRAIVRKTSSTAAVATAHDAETAIRHIHKQAPDLLLLDLRMPTMNGIELAMYLRGTHLADSTTIVAVSALAGDDDLTLLRQLGITQFIPKGPGLDEQLPPVIREVERRRT